LKIELVQSLKKHSKKLFNSISFLPAFMVIGFLVLSTLMIMFDYSDTGKLIKSNLNWLRLKDASTARSIVSVIAAGLISLTVFSFSMVMIVLNQAASHMSNRVLDKLIGNRYQQLILGFYIGTIVYSLFLLTAIRDIDDGIYVPALSTYLLIVFAVAAIFLFIYFLHYITQSIKYEIIINRIFKQTREVLEKTCRLQNEPEIIGMVEGSVLKAKRSGIFEGFEKEELVTIAEKEDLLISFHFTIGTFVLQDAPIASVSGEKLHQEIIKKIQISIHINSDQSIEKNFHYGFMQLVEIAVKALSPGINDPATAIESMRALTRLLSIRLQKFPDNTIRDKKGKIRILTVEKSFEDLFMDSFQHIWQYGKDDRLVQKETIHLLKQLETLGSHQAISRFMNQVRKYRTEE
jgi:uncharacterized membrane protein